MTGRVEVGEGAGSRSNWESHDLALCGARGPLLFDKIGRNGDIRAKRSTHERGINLCHGYLTEYSWTDVSTWSASPRISALGALRFSRAAAAKAIEQGHHLAYSGGRKSGTPAPCQVERADRLVVTMLRASRSASVHACDQAWSSSRVFD